MRLRFILIDLCAILLWGCGSDKSDDTPQTTRTVIVYLAVDNNFSGEDKEKIAALTEGWQSDFEGHLLVYADPRPDATDRDNPDGLPYLTEIRWENGKAVAQVVRRYEEHNSADANVFRQVLSGIIADYPADSYGLVMLSHASGWLPEKTLTRPSSVGQDNGKEMELTDFAEALPVKMDFIAFDACLMGGVEVACELRDKADFVVFSPAEVLVPGFAYRTMPRHLMAPIPDLTAVAREFYDYFNAQSGMFRSATVSVIDLSKMDALIRLAANLLPGADGEQPVDLSAVQQYGYGRHPLYFDLGDYLSQRFPNRAQDIEQAIGECTVYRAATPGYYSAGTLSYSPIRHFSGLSVYVPQAAYPFLNSEYRKLQWTRATNQR